MTPPYHSSTEDELSQVPRPSKRQKITPISSSRNEPFSSRVLKTVKQAVYKKLPNPKEDTFGSEVTPTNATTNVTPQKAPNERASLWSDEPDELGDEENGAMMATPTKPQSSSCRKTPAKVQVITGAGTVGNTTKAASETPSRKRGKKYKGWEYLKEYEDVGINNQDAFAKIAEEAAKEAAKSKADDTSATIVSTKSLRERRPRVLPASVNLQEKKDESTKKVGQKRKRKDEERLSSKKGRRDEEEIGSFRAHDILTRSGSVDDLHDGQPLGQEVMSVQIKLPKNQSTPKKKDGIPVVDFEADYVPNGEPDPLDDLSSTWISPQKVSSQKDSSKHSTTKNSTDPSSTAALQPDVWRAASQEDLLKTATHLQSSFSRYPAVLTAIKTQLLFQLTCKSRLPTPPYLSKEYETLHQLLSRTVQTGEGNSMLLIGSRGSGKSALVETAIYDLTQSNKDDFYVVRLNGFIHTDDKMALREIWRQLGKELEGENDETSLRNNYADILTSLLALLSHQDESQDEGGEQISTAKSVIFVLDEFDLFAQHPRQTLLYNLFDVAQSHRNAPIAVLGLTTKVHVVDSLEKRVKSRFSQRSIHLSLPKDFQAFKSACLGALTYHNPSESDPIRFTARLQHYESEDRPLAKVSQSATTELPEKFVEAWNAYARALLSTGRLTEALHVYYATFKRPSDFQTAIALPLIYALNLSNLSSISQLPPYRALAAPDSTLGLLPGLSILQLSLLIAACRLGIILSTDICSFEMAYEEYLGLVKRSKVQSSSSGQFASGTGIGARGHDVARRVWQELETLELLVPTTGWGNGGKDRDGRWRADISLEEIGAWLEGEGKGISGTQGLVKWCKEI